jgi:hypothetical protein
MDSVDEHEFWEIVDETRAEARGNLDAHVESLHARLSGLDVDEVVEFDRLLVEANHALYSWTLWGAADLLFGSCGDDAFTDARSWVVSLGSSTYHEALADPEALADIDVDVDPDDLTVAERWAGVPAEVYAGHTGRHLEEVYPDRVAISLPDGEPVGTQLSDEPEVLAEHFPRLAQRFG